MEAPKNDMDRLPSHIQEAIKKIHQYQNRIDNAKRKTPEAYVAIFNLQTEMNVFVSKVAAFCKGQHHNVKTARERLYWETYRDTEKQKELNANLAVLDLKDEEAWWYGQAERWEKAFWAIKEEANALKYKWKDDNESGANQGYHWEVRQNAR